MSTRSVMASAVALLAIIVFAVSAYAVLGECQPYGDVAYQGRTVQDGLEVEAFVGEIVVARSTTMGGGYSLAIPHDNPGTVEKDGWAMDDIITIRINGRTATPSFTAFAGSQRHNLEVTTLDVTLDTWGKIKALFQ